MARITATIVSRQRWWLQCYLVGVLVMAYVTGREPNPDRLAYWVRRGIKVEVK